MDIVNPTAQAYAEKYSSGETALLSGIAEYTFSNHAEPQMLSGHLQGRFLEMISHLQKPRRILEIGTFMGYSAICLAGGLAEGGKLHTLELRAEDGALAAGNFRRAKLEDRIILHIGNALEIIPTLKEVWDLVFIDADKVGYAAYYRLVLPLVRSGGLIIADNVLYHGQVLDSTIKGKNALGIQSFNDLVRGDDSVEHVMLTIRDGLMLIRKK